MAEVERHRYDVVVIGGGLAGWIAATAAREAGATVAVVVDYRDRTLEVTVTNGPPPGGAAPSSADDDIAPRGEGHGLVGMRERAHLLGGEVTASPTPDGGFRVAATLPVEVAVA